MHELSIARTITETALAELAKHPDHTVLKIVMRIGSLSDVVPDSLLFGFNAIKLESALSNTELVIEVIPAAGICNVCKHTFELSELSFQCPHCGDSDIKISGGRELDIAYLEIEELEAVSVGNSQGETIPDGTD